VVIDSARGRIYLCERVSRRVIALDVRGRKLWQADNIDASALAVDPATGNLWCTVGGSLDQGETVILDRMGVELASYPAHGFDIAYDPHTDSFWLVDSEITKLSRQGVVLFRKPCEGWACVSVTVNPSDGSVWIAEREHPDVARSANRLWHLDARGGVIRSEDLGAAGPFAVSCDPRTGIAWVAGPPELLRFGPDRRELPPLPIAAVDVAVSPTSKRIWVTTKSEVLCLDESGAILCRAPFESASSQSWLSAF
jgi:hypothetical protein